MAEARLRNLAQAAPTLLQRKLSGLSQLLHGERASVERTQAARWDISLTGTWPSRRATVAADAPSRIKVLVKTWFLRTSSWLVVFEAERALAEASAYLVGGTLAQSPKAVTTFTPDPDQWKQLFRWAGNAGPGKSRVLGGKFYETAAGGAHFKWLSMRLSEESSRRLLKDAFAGARGIGELLLETPRLAGIDESLVFRVSRGGVFRVYASEVPDSAVESLLVELARLWAPVP